MLKMEEVKKENDEASIPEAIEEKTIVIPDDQIDTDTDDANTGETL